jgi:prepilin-type processing-associated H-X9-DG protein
LADYALCAWGPGGRGTLVDPYYRYAALMPLSHVRRAAETLLFADGITTRMMTEIRSRHGNDTINGVFLDGHAHRLSRAEMEEIDQDQQGYYYRVSAADR